MRSTDVAEALSSTPLQSFNITNTPNFSQSGTLSYTSKSFASITGNRDAPGDAREMQFALKYIFGRGHQE